MAKKKLIYFAQNKQFDCLHELDVKKMLQSPHAWRGEWNRRLFGGHNDLIVEAGCGRGEYVLQMARMFPGKNFIGIDIKGSRLYHPAREISEEGMANAALLRCKIDFIDQIFAAEVNEIWVTFPDPFIEKPRRRLTSPFFLSRYHKVLKPGGIINLKTDNTEVYNSTLALAKENGLPILKATDDLYAGLNATKVESIKTTYERKFLEAGKKICLLRFVLDRQIDSKK